MAVPEEIIGLLLKVLIPAIVSFPVLWTMFASLIEAAEAAAAVAEEAALVALVEAAEALAEALEACVVAMPA